MQDSFKVCVGGLVVVGGVVRVGTASLLGDFLTSAGLGELVVPGEDRVDIRVVLGVRVLIPQ